MINGILTCVVFMKWHSCNIHGRHRSGLRDVQQINLSLFHPLIIFLFSDHHPGFPFVVLIIIHRVSNQPMGSKPQLSPPASPSGLAFLCSLLVAFMSVVCVMSVVCHRAVVLLLLCFPSFSPLIRRGFVMLPHTGRGCLVIIHYALMVWFWGLLSA